MTTDAHHSPGAAPYVRDLGPHTSVYVGADGGRYPAGNSLVVRGRDGALIVDPSTSLHLLPAPEGITHVLLTHAHEDHVAGVHLFPDAAVHVHHDDLLGVRSLDGLMQIYGMAPAADAAFREIVVRDFTYAPRPDATGLADGDVIDLGGVTVRLVHLPGHTRGHSGVLVEPDGVFVTGDIDLSAFGPYYGDEWSSLDAFEASLARARTIDTRWYVTFHHKGVVDGRDEYVRQLDAFTAVIASRESAMVAHLTGRECTVDDLAAVRFVYRPHVTLPFVTTVERRSAAMSLTRLVAAGRVREVTPGRFTAA
jgi:glyoxylase-like metal-dependent hydrolase (beta-lactamase superfamily II)